MNLHVWADHRSLYRSLLISHLLRKSRLLCSGSHIQQCYQEKSCSGRNTTEGTWRLRFGFHPCKSRAEKKSDIFGKVYFGNKAARQARVRGSSSCLQVKLTVSHRQHKAPFTHFISLGTLFHTLCWLRPRCQAEYTQTRSGCYSVCSGTWEVCKLLVCLALFPFLSNPTAPSCHNHSCCELNLN